MRDYETSEAQARFDELLDAASREPVSIRRDGREMAVIVSSAHYARLAAQSGNGPSERVKALHARSAERYAAVYEALAK